MSRDEHPNDRPQETLSVDLAVIGGGAAGLSTAAGAAQMGASVVLFEANPQRDGIMGGDCLHFGCVPSKALLAAGHAAKSQRHTAIFGVAPVAEPTVDMVGVQAHVHSVIGQISPVDSCARYTGFGVRVVAEHARFTGPTTVQSTSVTVQARRVVVATGSQPMVPPVSGLDMVPYLTNETIFTMTETPRHLLVLGGGPIGLELAQAHRHLGIDVTVIEMNKILPKDDPELVEQLRESLLEDGITIMEGAKVTGARAGGVGVALTVEIDGATRTVEGSHLLVAAGRVPTVDGLDLERADIAYSKRGIAVDARMRTSNKKVFAIGDVAGGYQFTHMAGHHAGVVIKNALFRLPAKAETRVVPWVTYTDPELAQVGLTEAQARERHGKTIRVLRFRYDENDRAIAERKTKGMVKVMTTAKGHILGASIAGAQAGELIQTWVLAMAGSIKIGTVASMIAPYPTLGEINKRAAGSFFTPKLFGEGTKKLVRLLAKLG